MQRHTFEKFGVSIAVSMAALAFGQIAISPPAGWLESVNGGSTELTQTNDHNTYVNFLSGPEAPNGFEGYFAQLLAARAPGLSLGQCSTCTGLDGKPIVIGLADSPLTPGVVIFAARPGDKTTHTFVVGSNDPSKASQGLETFAPDASKWLRGAESRSTSSHDGNGIVSGAGSASGSSSGGGGVGVSSTTTISPDGHSVSVTSSSSSSSSSQQSNSSQQSAHDSKTDSQSNHDSQSSHQSNSDHKSDRDSNSDHNSNSNGQSNSQSQTSNNSKRQVVYDPLHHSFLLVDKSRESGELRGKYAYSSDLLAAPIGEEALPGAATSTVEVVGGQLSVTGQDATKSVAAHLSQDGNTVLCSFPNGVVEEFRIAILDVQDGQITKFAIGPCVYSKVLSSK